MLTFYHGEQRKGKKLHFNRYLCYIDYIQKKIGLISEFVCVFFSPLNSKSSILGSC